MRPHCLWGFGAVAAKDEKERADDEQETV